MDAVKFLQERSRMYKTGAATPSIGLEDDYDPVIAVNVVEKWAAEHPRKTRQSVFLERYPEAQIGDNGVLCVCPATISPLYRKDGGGCRNIHRPCGDCRREFWSHGAE